MNLTPYAKVWDMLKTIQKFRIFIDKDSILYLDLAVRAAKISECKYETKIRNRP